MISLSEEKKKTKWIDNELNPVWNEVNLHYKHTQTHTWDMQVSLPLSCTFILNQLV